MKRELKDYLHLYLGCECESAFVGKNQRFVGITKTRPAENAQYIDSAMVQFIINGRFETRPCSPRLIKPILRPLSDMTEEEFRQLVASDGVSEGDYLSGIWYGDKQLTITYNSYGNKSYKHYESDALPTKIIPFLLSKHFDLFGLIEAGLAIDSTTLKKGER